MADKIHNSHPGNGISVFITVYNQKDASSKTYQAGEKMDWMQLNDDGEGGNQGWEMEKGSGKEGVERMTGDEMRGKDKGGEQRGKWGWYGLVDGARESDAPLDKTQTNLPRQTQHGVAFLVGRHQLSHVTLYI